MANTDLQSETFQQLLADALRAGPGSPEWRQAVSILREHGDAPQADEYQLLITARERLESGKPYREVRPGPAFTRKVMEQVEQYDITARRWNSPTVWIALCATAALIAVVVLLARFAGTEDDGDYGLQALGQTYFVTPRLVADFEQPISPDWQPIGALQLAHSTLGLRPVTGEGERGDYIGGGIVTAVPIPPRETFAVDAQVRARNLSDDLIPQVFITDTPDFSAELGTSPHEMAWLIKSGRCVVALPDGRFEGRTERVLRTLREPLTVRIVVNDRFALVECDGERLWSGEHQLDPARPRYVGLRFLRRGSNRQDNVAFESVRILLPQETP